MSFFKASRKAEDVKQGGTNYIVSSGFYPVTVLAAIVNVSKGGSESIDLYVENAGQKQMLYGNLRITNNDGTPNKIGAKVFNQLLIIADLDSVSDPVEEELPIGKDGKMKTVAVIPELSDLDIIIRVQMEYGKHRSSYTEKKVIKGFFRMDDYATAEEIVHEETPGKGYEREQKYAENVTYKDGVTEEQIKKWVADKRPEGTASDSDASEDSGQRKRPAFGKRRSSPAEEESNDD